MFIGGILGKSAITVSSIPDGEQYDSATFTGEINLMNNKMYDIELSDTQVDDVGNQVWDFNTVFLGDYNDSIEAGNITNNGLPIDGWRIRRRAEDQSLNEFLVDLDFDENVSEFIDYTPRNRTLYTYFVSSLSNNVEGQAIEGSGILDFYGWILSDYAVLPSTPTIQFRFDLEIESSDIKTNRGHQVYNNYTQFPAFRFDSRNYKTGSLSCIPYSVNGNEIEINLTTLETLRQFIDDTSIKTLRTTSGEQFQVITTNFSYKYYDKIQSQPYKISFDFTEIG